MLNHELLLMQWSNCCLCVVHFQVRELEHRAVSSSFNSWWIERSVNGESYVQCMYRYYLWHNGNVEEKERCNIL